MTIQMDQINRAGLSEDVLEKYSQTEKVKQMVIDLTKGDVLPDIIVYPKKDNLWTIADGIHRWVAYYILNKPTIEAKCKLTYYTTELIN